MRSVPVAGPWGSTTLPPGRNRHAGAGSPYHEAAALDDHFAELHFRLARCQFALGQFDQARREFALARDYAGAIQQFEAAQARLPHWISIRLGLSAALLGAGRADDALRILRQLEALHPESEEVKAGIMAAQSPGRSL